MNYRERVLVRRMLFFVDMLSNLNYMLSKFSHVLAVQLVVCGCHIHAVLVQNLWLFVAVINVCACDFCDIVPLKIICFDVQNTNKMLFKCSYDILVANKALPGC